MSREDIVRQTENAMKVIQSMRVLSMEQMDKYNPHQQRLSNLEYLSDCIKRLHALEMKAFSDAEREAQMAKQMAIAKNMNVSTRESVPPHPVDDDVESDLTEQNELI